MIGWVMFYIGYRGSIKYARFLIDEQEGDLIFDNFSINTDFDFWYIHGINCVNEDITLIYWLIKS